MCSPRTKVRQRQMLQHVCVSVCLCALPVICVVSDCRLLVCYHTLKNEHASDYMLNDMGASAETCVTQCTYIDHGLESSWKVSVAMTRQGWRDAPLLQQSAY